MAPTFADFLQSPLYTFFVGPDKKPIIVHAAAISPTSPQLDALINGGMNEAATQCARLEDVRVDDFIRFCEYAYRGDYTVPPCEEGPAGMSGASGNFLDNGVDSGGGCSSGMSKKDIKKKRMMKKPKARTALDVPPVQMAYPTEEQLLQELECEASVEPPVAEPPTSRVSLRTAFEARKYQTAHLTPKALILQHFEPRPNSSAHENFAPVLLAHARLYSFAHVRLIAPLQALTLAKLHTTLLDFKLYAERVGDIIELVRYVYSNEDLPGRRDDGTLDDLRRLVVEYVVCEIDTVGRDDGFVGFMEEKGEFVGDFWRVVRNHVA